MKLNNRDFKGVWIDKSIWLDKNLSATEKVILAEIDSLNNENGCYASNSYFAEFCQCSEKTVSRAITKLIQLGYVIRKSFDGRSRVLETTMSYRVKTDLSCQSRQNVYSVEEDRQDVFENGQSDKAEWTKCPTNNIKNNIDNNTLNKNHTHTNNIYSEEVCECVPENLKKLNVLSIQNGVYEIDFKKNFDLMIEGYPKSAGITASKKIIANYLTNGIPNIEGVTFSMISLSVRTYILEWKKSGRDKRYIKDLDNYLKSDDFIDNIIATRETYESGMLLNYGADWQNARFKYKGIDER